MNYKLLINLLDVVLRVYSPWCQARAGLGVIPPCVSRLQGRQHYHTIICIIINVVNSGFFSCYNIHVNIVHMIEDMNLFCKQYRVFKTAFKVA